MPPYKLTYFDSRGLGEMSRIICHLGKIPYEDVRIPAAEWPEKKKNFPFEQIPVLEVDGVQIPQSVAIARFLARKAGLAGKSDVEEALVDALADQFKDFFAETRPYYLAALKIFPESQETVDELYKSYLPAKERFFRFLTHYLQRSESGFLAGEGLTFVDLIIAEYVLSVRSVLPDLTTDFPEVDKHVATVSNIPEMKEYLEKRPVRPF